MITLPTCYTRPKLLEVSLRQRQNVTEPTREFESSACRGLLRMQLMPRCATNKMQPDSDKYYTKPTAQNYKAKICPLHEYVGSGMLYNRMQPAKGP
jgi:hypothetical protein